MGVASSSGPAATGTQGVCPAPRR
ncbi:Protein of unknown function [Thermobacillus xylanilyticus]|uniref:Uncharacterized protein n=1 Tax=Thermobacillus xylanilyticus TaxID=76633 RepID=A0ABN7RYP7_THEXY|nr:Protein of unknown function [Thermobacillus xylanilyticus]